MRGIPFVFFILLVFAFPISSDVYGRGGGSRGSGGGSGWGEGSGMGGGQMEYPSGGQQRSGERKMFRETQRFQLRECATMASGVRDAARRMHRFASGGDFSREEALEMHNSLRNELRLMEQKHAGFVAGLDNEQKERLGSRLRNINEIRQRLHASMGNMGEELEKETFDGKRIAERARIMEEDMGRWEEQYRSMDFKTSEESPAAE